MVWPYYSHSSLKHKSRAVTKTNCFYHHHSGVLLCPREQQTNKWWERSRVLRFVSDTLWETCYLLFSEVQTAVSISDGLNTAIFPKLFNSREWVAAVLLNENHCSMLNIASCGNQMADKLLGGVLKTMSCFDRSPLQTLQLHIDVLPRYFWVQAQLQLKYLVKKECFHWEFTGQLERDFKQKRLIKLTRMEKQGIELPTINSIWSTLFL